MEERARARVEAREAANSPSATKPTRLGEVFHDCLDLIRPLADRRRIRIVRHCPGLDDYLVNADRIRLKQVQG